MSNRNNPRRSSREKRKQDAHHRKRDEHLHDEWDGVAYEPENPLADDINFLQVILANPGGIGIHPFFIWGQYRDENGRLLAIDCLEEGTNRGNLKLGDLYLDANLSYALGGKNKAAQLKTKSAYFLLNDQNSELQAIPRLLDIEFLPDLILRRAYSILYDNRSQDTELFTKNPGGVRHGIVFNEFTLVDGASDRFVPEASDAPFEQIPLIVPDYLTQDDIDRIFRIAKNYLRHCMDNGIPAFWPKLKQWGNWPDEFMGFAETRSSYEGIALRWLKDSSAIVPETGFSCEP